MKITRLGYQYSALQSASRGCINTMEGKESQADVECQLNKPEHLRTKGLIDLFTGTPKTQMHFRLESACVGTVP